MNSGHSFSLPANRAGIGSSHVSPAVLVAEIGDLLLRCRACPTWDDRSEYKLPQWIEYVPENMIPYTSLPKMVRIRESLEEYLRIHEGQIPPRPSQVASPTES